MGRDWNAPPEATFSGEPDGDEKRPTPYECEYCFTGSGVFVCNGTWICEECARPRYPDDMVNKAMDEAGLMPEPDVNDGEDWMASKKPFKP